MTTKPDALPPDSQLSNSFANTLARTLGIIVAVGLLFSLAFIGYYGIYIEGAEGDPSTVYFDNVHVTTD